MFTNRKAVLHVDDDSLVTRIVGEHLREAGFECEAVNDANAAIERLIAGSYRIVLLDIHMPGRSGLQILNEIKSLDAGVQVIMLTALVNETTVLEVNRLGAEACLFKPILDPAPLIEAVDAAYERNCRWWHTLRELTRRRVAGEPPEAKSGATASEAYQDAV